MSYGRPDPQTSKFDWSVVAIVIAAISALISYRLLVSNQQLVRNQLASSKATAELWQDTLDAERRSHREDMQLLIAEQQHSQMPYLAVDYCCNPVPVAILDTGNKPTIIPNRDPDYAGKYRCEDSTGFVAKIRNYGAGPALETEVFWVPAETELVTGKKREYTLLESNNHHNPRTWPAFILPGQSASVNHLPTYLARDLTAQVKQGSGHLRIVCKDRFGDTHEFKHFFTFKTSYEPKDEFDPSVIGFHFNNIESAPLRHRVAKPPISERWMD